MTRLAWGLSGQRFFEAGTDRGVFYLPGSAPGVPWNGLISVSEKPSGGEPKPYYMDGIKYLNVAAAEEFEATISAFSAPDEFARCDGSFEIAAGLFATQQPRILFGLSYRTLIGNDLDGLGHGYKIHLVYDALAKPAGRDNKTLENSTTPTPLAWDITTIPKQDVEGFKPSAHFVVDSRKTPQVLIDELESILYGSVFNDPRLPDPYEIVELFTSYAELEVMARFDDGSVSMTNVPVIMSSTTPSPAAGNSTLWLDTSAGDYSLLKQVIGE